MIDPDCRIKIYKPEPRWYNPHPGWVVLWVYDSLIQSIEFNSWDDAWRFVELYFKGHL